MECGVFGCRAHRKHMVSLLIVLCGLMGTRAQDVVCSVTQGPRWTSYSVQENNGTGCEYSWSNSSHVVATHLSEVKPLVLNQSMNLLTTQICIKQVHYRRDCISEGVSYQVTCVATCHAEIRHDDRAAKPLGPLIKSRHHAWILVPASLVLLLVLFLSIRFGKCCCSNTRDMEADG